MQKRRTRIPLQGISNFKHNTQSSQLSGDLFMPQQSGNTSSWKKMDIKVKSNTNLSGQDTNIKTQNKKIRDNASINIKKVNEALKKKYEHKANVMKILRAWNFHSKGHITKNQLRTNFKECLKLEVSQDELDGLFDNYANEDGKMGVKQFLGMIYNKSNSAYFIKNIIDTTKLTDTDIKNLHDILEDVNSNFKEPQLKAIGEMTDFDINQLIKNSKRGIKKLNQPDKQLKNQEKQALQFIQSLSEKPIDYEEVQGEVYGYFRKNQRNKKCPNINLSLVTEKEKENCFAKTETNFRPKCFDLTFTNSFKSTKKISLGVLEPRSMTGINQRKTRFGATPAYEPLLLGNQQLSRHSSTVEILKHDRQAKKMKNSSRLAQIRAYREQQNMRIGAIDDKLTKTMHKNLEKKRLEKDTYQYTAYLKNRWL